MKAKFFLLGLCALALAACSIDEVSQINDTNAVTFKATTITRADVTTTNNLQEFSVWAWNTDNNGVTNEFMDDVIATRNGTSSTFTTSPLYFWPTGTVDFYALAPATGVTAIEDNVEYAFLGGEINEGDDVNPNWTYEGYVAKAQIANGNIVIDACIPSLPEDQIDLCYGVALGKSSGSVPMNFRHALSQIAFKAKSANTAFDVKIADVSVCSVYKEGVYTIGATETSTHLDEGTSTSPAAGTQGAWELTTTDDSGLAIKGRYLVDMTSSVVSVPTDGDVVELVDPYGTLMLLPQTIVAWDPLTDYSDTELGSYLRILCHVEESGSQLWPNNAAEDEETDLEATGAFKTIDGVEYAEIAIPLTNVEWEQGYRYTYTIIFGEGLGYYPPDDPNTDLEGKPVLDIITFNVTVDEFQDADGVDVKTDTDLSTISVSSSAELEGAIHSGYQEIVVTDDITLTDQIDVSYDLHLVLEADLTKDSFEDGENTAMNYFFHVINGATLTIDADGYGMASGGTNGNNADDWVGCIAVGSYNGTAITEYGHVIINSGSFYGGVWSANDECYNSVPTVYVMAGDAVINGGTFYGGWSNEFKSDGAKNDSGWTENTLNCNDTPRSNGEAWIYVYGGTFRNFDPANNATEGANTNYCPDGYATVSSTDDDGNTWYTVIKTTVATPADLAAALAAGASEITVSESFSIEQGSGSGYFWSYNDCTITLEDGVTISLDEMGSIANYAFFIAKSGTLTIEGNGTLKSNGSTKDMGCMCFWVDGGNVVINGGNFYSAAWAEESSSDTAACVYVNLGTATINGGSFYGSHNVTAYSGSSYLLNCTDKNYTSGTAKIYVYGGAFCDFDPADNYAEGEGTNFVVDGYKSVKSDDVDADGWYWYTVSAQ